MHVLHVVGITKRRPFAISSRAKGVNGVLANVIRGRFVKVGTILRQNIWGICVIRLVILNEVPNVLILFS
jgi:hypothetical protein